MKDFYLRIIYKNDTPDDIVVFHKGYNMTPDCLKDSLQSAFASIDARGYPQFDNQDFAEQVIKQVCKKLNITYSFFCADAEIYV